MIKKISIKNYKSIVDDEIELGRVNVFIGENGAGKSNILEAVGMFSAAKNFNLSIENLVNKGVRMTKPGVMFSSFKGKKQKNKIYINTVLNGKNDVELSSQLIVENGEEIYPNWTDKVAKEQVSNVMDNLLETAPHFPAKAGISHWRKQITANTDTAPDKTALESLEAIGHYPIVEDYQVYSLSTLALRGITKTSWKQPLGLYGEGLDTLLGTFTEDEWQLLRDYSHFISWLDKVVIDEWDSLKFEGHKPGPSTSKLYFTDKFMRKNNNIFSAEVASEGALYVLFYLALFISKKTPSFFAIDNIETALNPKICRALIESITELAEKTNKQVLITTHNPAILDGIDLNNDNERLFVVSRNNEGHTKTKRIQFKPGGNQNKRKLSEYWMRGVLGGLPNNFI